MQEPPFPSISDYLFHHAARTPDRLAWVLGNDRGSYLSLAQQVERCARALLAAGVRHGDRVVMLCTPRPEFLITLLAAADIGAIWVGLHPRYQLPEMRHVVDIACPKVLFAMPEIDGRDYRQDLTALAKCSASLEAYVAIAGAYDDGVAFGTFLSRGDEVTEEEWVAARSAVDADDTAAIIFTSGTTGAPKGAMVKHYGLITGALVENRRWPSVDVPIVLNNMPNNHIAGLGMLSVFAMVAGGAVVFMERFDAEALLSVLETEGVTFWLQAPTMFHLALSHPRFSEFDLTRLEYIIWAGAPMPRDLVERLHRLGPRLGTAFGMTELSVYATYSDEDAPMEVLANTIGRPESAYEVRIADPQGHPQPVGEEGEIQARGRWLMNGYFNDPKATREAYTADGWFRTGDVAVAGEDGNWTMVGRTKEMYKSGGFNIYPREIEIAIEAHPSVAASAVVGVSDPLYQEVGVAFVQPEPGHTVSPAELDGWCRTQLANYKVPKSFTVMTQLPRLAIGKIDKQLLKSQVK